ncbi:Binding-protein-dependent transport systems inner membrane component [Nostocoides japonicum T1-X7]|uniref:Binding-protein-dependent transport systems inner membrane component n=1 Tax=Nostocoides japonicum T1-X7 TaxID=1194083 RepID=A0A077LSN5_9MICO|nr:sugar ABC transporter permease [Tetrasphaera japonica]CCH76043.1 Binding-protein-dependent transport systems inner membrane component [Tetrasphaera japonica T1-X7]
MHGKRRGRFVGWLYILPALLLYGGVVLYPAIQSVNISLYSWDGVSTPTWVGLGNYTDFLSDPELRIAIEHIGVLVVFYAFVPILLGLLSASLLARHARRGYAVYRWVIFLPQVLTSVVVAVLWKQLYGPDGPINTALEAVGLGALTKDWLGDFTWALPALGLVGTWTTLGLCMVLFVSGSAAIPTSLYDAARVDGAGAVREFFAVTLPALRPQIAVALVLTVTGALRTFDLVWLTTRGGPGTSTITPSLLLYVKAFSIGDVGAAAAIGVVMAVVCLLLALVIVRVSEQD